MGLSLILVIEATAALTMSRALHMTRMMRCFLSGSYAMRFKPVLLAPYSP